MCSEESGCITKTLNCPHARGEHDETCGYVAPSDGAECGFVCDQCNQNAAGENGSQQGAVNQPNPYETAVCTCTERCQEGAGNAQCPVCAADPAACAVQDMQEPTCGGMEGCIDGKHDPACPLYEAPACSNLEGCADDKHNPACPLYVAPTCSNLEGCADGKHNPACPLYVAPTCSNLVGCVDDKHDPNCPLYVAEEPAELADEGLTGPCGDNATYTLTPNDEAASTYTLTISGTGAMTDFVWDGNASAINAGWGAKRRVINKVIIEDGITYIGKESFRSFSILEEVRIPDSVTEIGEKAFYYSAGSAPNGLSFSFPNRLQKVGSGAFYKAGLRKSLIIPETVTDIGGSAFAANNIPVIVVKSPAISLGDYAFGSQGGTLVAWDLSSVSNLNAGKFISQANANALVYVRNTDHFESLKDIANVSHSKAFAITNGGTFAPSTTFEAGKLATPIKAGYGFEGWYANTDFSGDAVTQPESGKTYYAKWVKLDGFCGSEGNGENVSWKLIPNTDTPSTYTLNLSGTGAMADVAYDWNGADSAPWAAFRSQITQIVVGDGITKIGNYAFIKTAIQSIDLSNCTSLTHIGERGIANIPTLTSIQLPSSIVELGSAAFSGTGIESVDLANCQNLTTLGVEAFSHCKQLKSVNIQQCEKLTAIGNSCFTQCTSLADLKLPKNIQTVGSSVLAYTAVTRVDWSNLPNLTSIDGQTFRGNPNLTVISLAGCSSLQTLGDYLIADSGVVAVDITGCASYTQSGTHHDFEGLKEGGVVYSSKELDLRNWPISCAITNGGTFAPDTSFEAGKLATPTKDGHVFLGWYDNKDFTGDAVTQPVSGKTYYAKWEESVALSITLSDGTTLALNLPKDSTVADVKQRIQQELLLAPAQMVLTFNDQTLEDGKDLTACGIENGSTLSLNITGNFDMTNYGGIRMFIYPDRVELVNPIGNEPNPTKSFPYTGAFTFSGSTHDENIIFYNGSYAVTLDNYNCMLRNTYAGSCLDLRDGANVTVTLKGTNKLVASWEGSAIRVPSGTTVTIGGDGTLDASYQKGQNAAYGAAIGGESNHDFGTIRITGGTIKASGHNDYCIGAGNNYNSQIEKKTGTIDITGGTVIANTIGNADQKTGAVVNITGGTVRCNNIYADTTGVETFVYGTDGKNPRVYGNVTLGENYTLPADEKLTIQNNATLTIPEGVTLNVEGGHLDNNGIIENYGTIVGATDGMVQKPSALTLTVTGSENTPVTEATYGDIITIIAKIAEKATTRAITNNKMAFYLGDIQLGDLDVQTDGTAQLKLALSGDHWMPGKKTLTVKFTGSNSLTKVTAEMELTVKKAPQAAPVPVKDFTVGYQNEKLTFSPSVEVWTAKDGGTKLTSPVSLSEHLGKTLYARFMETDTLLASDWTAIPIAQRPAAPTGITGGRATLNGVKDTMEYSLDGKTFTKVPTDATKAENLKAGIYLVRFAATATAPASSAVQVTVYDSTGSLTTTETNGSVTTETTQRDDGTSTVITTEKKPNGTVESLLENKDKNGKMTSSQTTITQPDGSKVVIQLPDNGSKVVTEYDKNGEVIQQTTYPDKNKPAYIISGYTPKIVEGNGRRFWGWSLALRTDDALCNFQDVLVQGLSLNPRNYEVSEKNGTTQITLKRGYLSKLPAGTYKIGIVSTNGTAWGTFVIPTNAEGWNPGTGDYILIAGATLLLTTAALTLLLLRRKRRQ